MIAALAPAQVCAFVAALLATAAVLCRPRRPAVRGRLCDRPRGRAVGGPAADGRDAHGAGACMAGVRKTDVPGPVGIAVVLAAARAGLRAGGTMTEAFARQDAVGFATPRLTQARLLRLLEASRTVGETRRQAACVAGSVHAVYLLNASLGCGAARCLDVVMEDYRRMRMLDDLRRNAFAMPEATVRLLSALPGATVLLGELLGASPVAFLLGSDAGRLCLACGAVCYVAGLWWMRALLADAPTIRPP